MSNVLITGAGGFVGSHLAEAEVRLGNHVTGLDIAPPDKVSHLIGSPSFCYERHDILKKGVLELFIEKADIVYHFAAIADPSQYCFNPIGVLKLDLEATQDVIKLCHKHEKKLIFASTSEIYGKNPRVPWKENADRVLGSTSTHRWVYASSKAIGEHYCYAYQSEGLRFVIVRFFNFYGPRLDCVGAGRVIPCFMKGFLSGEPVEVVEPGDQTRCFTYVTDGVEAVVKAAHMDVANGLSFNIGTDKETTILELAEKMKEIGGFKSKIKMISPRKKYGGRYEDIFRRVPDANSAQHVLGWEPTTSLEIGLNDTIRYYVNNHTTA